MECVWAIIVLEGFEWLTIHIHDVAEVEIVLAAICICVGIYSFDRRIRREVGNGSAEDVERIMGAISRGSIWLDSWEELLEDFEAHVDRTTAVSAKIDDELGLLLLDTVGKEGA